MYDYDNQPDEVKAKFYDVMDCVISASNKLIILGNLNATVGRDY